MPIQQAQDVDIQLVATRPRTHTQTPISEDQQTRYSHEETMHPPRARIHIQTTEVPTHFQLPKQTEHEKHKR